MKEKLTYHIYRKNFLVSSLTTFSVLGAGLIDSLVISRFLGSNGVAAAGLASPFFFLTGIVYGWISTGFNSIASKKVVNGDIDGLNRVYSECVMLSVLVSSLAMLLLLGFARPVSFAFGARGNSADLLEPTKRYLIGLSLGFPAIVLTALVSVALQFDNGNRYIRQAYLIGMAADFLLDLIALRTGSGILGIGLASSLSYYISLVVLCLHFRGGKGTLTFRFVRFRKNDIKAVLYGGSGMAFYTVLSFIRPLIINPYIVFVGGNMAMAVVSARNSVINFVSIPGFAISDGLYITAQIAYNIRSRNELLETGRAAHKDVLLFCLLPGILLCLIAWPLSGFYLQDAGQAGRQLFTFALCMGGLRLILETLIISRIYYLQAIEKDNTANVLLLAYCFASVIICAFILGHFLGSYGIMAAFTVSDLAVLGLIYVLYAYKKRSPRVLVDDYLIVSEECQLSPGDIIELDIRNVEDCALAGEQVQLFCKGHKIDAKRSLYAGLCTEEGSNILLKIVQTIPGGVPASKENVKLHVTISNGKVRLHLRFYSPDTSLAGEIERLRSDHDAFFTEIVGETIIKELSGEVKSFNSMDINNWVIII